jgi:hypothetical protein
MGSAIFCGLLLVPRGIIFLTYLNRIPAQVNLFEQQLKSADYADYADNKDRGAGAVSRGRSRNKGISSPESCTCLLLLPLVFLSA